MTRGRHNFTVFDDSDRQMVTIEGTVRYHFTKGERDVPYLRNGDPGYPGSPPEVEFFDPVVEKIHLCIGDVGFDVEFDGLAVNDFCKLGPAAWEITNETEQANAVIEYEEEHARDGRDE